MYFCFCELVNLYVVIYSDFDGYLDIVNYEEEEDGVVDVWEKYIECVVGFDRGY